MTTSTKPPRQRPTAASRDEDSEWSHGPVAGAINASIISILLAAVIRATSLPPGAALGAGLVMAVVLVAAGRLRNPRPLAPRSLVYRAAAMVTAGVVLWQRTVDATALKSGAVIAVIAVGAAGLGAAAGVIAIRAKNGIVALISSAVTLVATVVATVMVPRSNVLSLLTDAGPLNRDMYLPWLWHSVLLVTCLAAMFAVLGQACANHEAVMDDNLARALLMRSHGREITMFTNILRGTITAPNIRVTRFERWRNGAGETYHIDGTVDGITPGDIDRAKDTLAAKLDLPEGCGLEAVKGDTRGRIRVDVSRVNKIREDHHYPREYVQRSIYNGIPIGVIRAGEHVLIKLREYSAFVWGQKRSGKTTTLYDIIAGVVQCTDAMVWVIDLGGGGAALPFLYPYAQGRVKVPAIDWVATTVEEANLMADVGLAIAKDRKVFYKHRKRKGNTNLLPLDADVPEILIVVDEGAEIMGENPEMSYEAKQVRAKLEEIVRIAGDSGVNIVFSGLAATQQVIDRMTKAQLAIRIGMRCSDAAELAYGFDDYNLNPDDVPFQGSGFVKPGHEDPIRVFKAFLLEPEQMDEIAVAVADWRPELDDRGAEVGGRKYAERWQRTAHLLTDEEGNLLIEVGRSVTATATLPRPPTPSAAAAAETTGGAGDDADDRAALLAAGRRPTPPPPGSPDDAIAQADAAMAALDAAADKADADNAAAGVAPPPVDDEDADEWSDDPRVQAFREQLAADWNPADPTTWPTMPAPARIEAEQHPHGPTVLEALVRHHGPKGLMAKDIKEKLRLGGPWGPPVSVSVQTIHAWLGGKGHAKPEWLARREPRQAYVHRDHVPPWTGQTAA